MVHAITMKLICQKQKHFCLLARLVELLSNGQLAMLRSVKIRMKLFSSYRAKMKE